MERMMGKVTKPLPRQFSKTRTKAQTLAMTWIQQPVTLMIYDFIWRDYSETGLHDGYYRDNLKFKKLVSSPPFTNSPEYGRASSADLALADQEIPAAT
jgi:hypothetical protein